MTVKSAVIDTNVLISSALTRGTPFKIVRDLIQHNALLFSVETIEELSSQLMRSKVDKYVSQADLLSMHPFKKLAIFTPADTWKNRFSMK